MPAPGAIVIVVVCVVPLVLLFWWFDRISIKEEARWEYLAGGTVADAVVSLVPYSTAFGDLGYPMHPATQTVIVFDDGRRLAVIGNFAAICAKGVQVSVFVNGLGTFRVDPVTG